MRKPSPAVVVASVALFFSLSGAGFAASSYVIQNTQQIRPRVLRALEGSTGHRGVAGHAGPMGPAGPVGATGSFSTHTIVTVDGPVTAIASGAVGSSLATCPTGASIVSGGNAGPLQASTLTANQPVEPNAWEVVVDNTTVIPETVQAIAVCST